MKIDKQEILKDLIKQLEKDTGFDNTSNLEIDDLNLLVEKLRTDLGCFLKKTASQNHIKFMNIIYRVDIPQSKLEKIKTDENYFESLAEMVLNRIFQKILTMLIYKSKDNKST